MGGGAQLVGKRGLQASVRRQGGISTRPYMRKDAVSCLQLVAPADDPAARPPPPLRFCTGNDGWQDLAPSLRAFAEGGTKLLKAVALQVMPPASRLSPLRPSPSARTSPRPLRHRPQSGATEAHTVG